MIMIAEPQFEGMCVWVKKEHECNGTSVSMDTRHPECEKCGTPGQDNCEWCRSGKEFKLKPSYAVTVRYDDGSHTKDEFDSFYDAFDSFTNIVKTLTKET